MSAKSNLPDSYTPPPRPETRSDYTTPQAPQLYSAEGVPDYADIQTERAVLASVLAEPDSLNTVIEQLGSFKTAQTDPKQKGREHGESYFRTAAKAIFHDPKHAALYEGILEIAGDTKQLDLLTIADHLQRTGKLEILGGMDYLIEVQGSVASSANLESWCGILKDYAMMRETVQACKTALAICRDPSQDIKTMLDSVESAFFNVRNSFSNTSLKSIATLMYDAFQFFNDVTNHNVEPGIPTGFPDLDQLTGGLKKQEMFVLAARPSVGKTSLALNIATNIILREPTPKSPRKKVAFFSLEMSAEQIAQRLLCAVAKVPLSKIMSGAFNPNELNRLSPSVDILSKTELYIDPTGGLSLFELRAKARKLSDQHGGLDLIIIDYLQLMKDPAAARESRQAEVAAISGGLKKLAKDLNVPVLVLAQLNREVEKGPGAAKGATKPKLSNLRESGAIEQDADAVVFLHDTTPKSEDGAKDAKPAEHQQAPYKDYLLIVAKNRNGSQGEVKIRFVGSLMEFQSIDHRYEKSDTAVQ